MYPYHFSLNISSLHHPISTLFQNMTRRPCLVLFPPNMCVCLRVLIYILEENLGNNILLGPTYWIFKWWMLSFPSYSIIVIHQNDWVCTTLYCGAFLVWPFNMTWIPLEIGVFGLRSNRFGKSNLNRVALSNPSVRWSGSYWVKF